jgi:thiol-disulfide isomerase/thioredoxin
MIGTMAPASTQPQQVNFEERMRKLVTDTETKVRQSTSSWSSSSATTTSNNAGTVEIPLSSIVRQVKCLKEYTAMLKEVVVNVHDDINAPITVVRFYSTYCPACKKSQPAYTGIIRRHLAQQQQQQQQQRRGINWVDVEANSSNLDLQQALGLKTIPTGLIYHPQAGLVEQMSFGKKNLKLVEETIQSYLANECQLPPSANEAAMMALTY